MNPNFLQGNKDHQMRLVTYFSSIHIPMAAHMTTLYSKNQPKYVKKQDPYAPQNANKTRTIGRMKLIFGLRGVRIS